MQSFPAVNNLVIKQEGTEECAEYAEEVGAVTRLMSPAHAFCRGLCCPLAWCSQTCLCSASSSTSRMLSGGWRTSCCETQCHHHRVYRQQQQRQQQEQCQGRVQQQQHPQHLPHVQWGRHMVLQGH